MIHDHDDLTHHAEGTYDVLLQIQEEHYPTKVPLMSMGAWELMMGGGNSTYYHNFRFSYGKLHEDM